MKRLKTWWLLVVALLVAPHLLLLIAGVVWLHQRGWLWYWMIVSALITLVGWQVARWLRKMRVVPPAMRVEPVREWPPATHAAWQDVEKIALRVEAADLPLDRIEPAWEVLQEVFAVVARHYHPKARRPELQIPATHALKIVELVARDLREAFSENVPGAHILRLGDLQNVKAAFDWVRNLYLGYRIVSFAYDPISALVREMRELAGRGVTSASTGEIKRWAVGYYVRKSGYYAIRLYGGELVLDDVAFESFTTAESQKDAQRADRDTLRLGEEPLRILVVGQVKAGKSSLINAVFGEVRVAADVVCNTRRAQPYVLERGGIRQAIIYDTVGYDTSDAQGDPFGELRELITRSDLVLFVCSATSAARGIDHRLLHGIRAHYQENPHRAMPPVVVAVTHIDQLRPFAEWDPPYDVVRAKGGKAAEIRHAAQAVAEDMEVAPESVVPVCVHPDRVYNVDEALMPAIVAASPQAEQVKYQRCLREFRRKENWQQLWQQAINAGRLLVRAKKKAPNDAE